MRRARPRARRDFPTPWRGDAARIFDFCARIVDATKDLVCAFKPQIAYFAAHRAEDQLERLMGYIRRVAPDVPVILDAKRGDIGSTAEQYAREAFVRYQADAVTLSPFMGFDSIEPYLAYDGRGLILLCRTSNPGGADLQAPAAGLGRAPVRADCQAGSRGVEPQRPARPGGRRHISGRAGARARTGADAAAADPRASVRRAAMPTPRCAAGWRRDGPIIVNSSRAVLYAGGGDGLRRRPRARRRAPRATCWLPLAIGPR